MRADEVERLTKLEDRHWWYAERRWVLRRLLRGSPVAGPALDVGAAGGGNSRVLRELGWSVLALEYGVTGARVALSRGVAVACADAQRLPIATQSVGLVIALDVLEHLAQDTAAAHEMHRVLRPGGRLVVTVPADPRLWSAHDEAVGHLRRYTREDLSGLLEGAGFVIDRLWAWNVLLRPVVARRRRTSTGSDLEAVPALLNVALRGVVALERYLPFGRSDGVSLVVCAHRP